MRILLTTINTDNKRSDLELRYLYSVLCDAPIELDMRRYGRYETSSDIFESIMQGYYDLVYLHADSENIHQIAAVAQMLKKAAPENGIMIGGMEVSFETYDFMRDNPYVDYVVRGECETVMYNFIRAVLSMDYRFETIAGLAFRTQDGITVNPFDDPVDMHELPFPYEKTESGRGIVYYETMRGTTDRSIHRQYLPDPRVRSLGINRVCTELRYFLAKDVEKVVFFGIGLIFFRHLEADLVFAQQLDVDHFRILNERADIRDIFRHFRVLIRIERFCLPVFGTPEKVFIIGIDRGQIQGSGSCLLHFGQRLVQDGIDLHGLVWRLIDAVQIAGNHSGTFQAEDCLHIHAIIRIYLLHLLVFGRSSASHLVLEVEAAGAGIHGLVLDRDFPPARILVHDIINAEGEGR